tara:strand:- start:706 stop:897 length:192 start_codon:yes stop_codon:yes gene_type:complete
LEAGSAVTGVIILPLAWGKARTIAERLLEPGEAFAIFRGSGLVLALFMVAFLALYFAEPPVTG